MEKVDFKFQPLYVSFLSLISLLIIYKVYTDATASNFHYHNTFILMALFALGAGSIFLPMGIKMLLGIPAVQLTDEQLVDNVAGVSIDWSNIKDISVTGIRKPFISITLKDTALFYSGINNPVKRLLLKFLFMLSPESDVSINLAMVASSNESVIGLTRVYLSRYYGDNE